MKLLRDSLSLWPPSDEDPVVLPGNLFQCFTVQWIILKNKVQSWKASKCEWKHLKINTVLYKEKIGVRWHRKEIPGRFNAWSGRPYSSRNFILFLNSFISALWIWWPLAPSGSGTSCALVSAEASFGMDWLTFGYETIRLSICGGWKLASSWGWAGQRLRILSPCRDGFSLWPLNPCFPVLSGVPRLCQHLFCRWK